jgi:uncharacterized membrane protein YfcA
MSIKLWKYRALVKGPAVRAVPGRVAPWPPVAYGRPRLDLATTLRPETLMLAALLLGTGLGAGVLAGLLGVGGGIVIVPVLYQVFSFLEIDEAVRMHAAVATSLATIVFTAARSSRSHWQRGAVDVPLLRAWAGPVLVGVLAGSAVAGHLTGRALSGVFAAVALAVALHMAFGKASWRLAMPRGPARALLGAAVGTLSVLMGLGGGTLGVPVLTLLGTPIRRAVGTAAGLGLLVAIPGALSFMWSGRGVPGRPPGSLGYVNLLGFALIAPATVLAAPLGVRIAHAVDPLRLRRAFALFLGLVSLRMLSEVVGS